MSFYNTGNPVPSIDPRDLDDNAKHIDEIVNSTLPTFTDRLGATRKTLAGIESDSDAILLRSDLADSGGSGLIDHDGETVANLLNQSRPLANYAALRNYTGTASVVRITQTGIAGFFINIGVVLGYVDNGVHIIGVDGRIWERQFDGPANAMWFGAKNTGKLEDGIPNRRAFNSAFTYCASLPITLATPDGVYYVCRENAADVTPGNLLDTSLVVRGNVTWTGQSKNGVIIRRHPDQGNSMLINFPDENTAFDWSYGQGGKDIVVESLTLDANPANAPWLANIAYMYAVDRFTFRNVKFLDAPGLHCVDANSCRDGKIIGCEFSGYAANLNTAPGYYPEAIQFGVDLRGTSPTVAPPSIGIEVCGNSFGPSSNFGAHNVAFGNHTTLYTAQSQGVHFYENKVTGMLKSGLNIFAYIDAKIHDNWFYDCVSPLMIEGSINPKDQTGAQSGVPCHAKDIWFYDNHLIRPKGTAPVFNIPASARTSTQYARAANINIYGNQIVGDDTLGPSQTLFLIAWSDGVYIHDNVATGTFAAHLKSSYTAHGTFKDNILGKSVGISIAVDEAGSVTEWAGTGLTTDWDINNNNVAESGLAGIDLKAIVDFRVKGNRMLRTGSTTAAAAVNASAVCKNGFIDDNHAYDARNAVTVDATCIDIVVGPHLPYKSTQRIVALSGTGASFRIPRITSGTAAPTAGYHDRGDMHTNLNKASGQVSYWDCTAGGTPGTWVAGPLTP